MGKFSIYLFAYTFILSSIAFSQDSLIVGTKFVPVPELSFNTDDGVKIAGEVHVYDYGYNGKKPFESFSRVRISYSTIGAFALHGSRDVVDSFGSGTRAFYYGFLSRNLSDYYFGDTDKQDYDEVLFENNEYYHFEMFRADFGVLLRTPLESWEEGERLQFKKGISLIYETPLETQSTDFIQSENIEGLDGAFLTILEMGLILDQRNSEFRAGNGYLLDIGARYAPPLVSTHHNLNSYVTALGFLPIERGLFPSTLAARFSFLNSVGDTPYWVNPSLGGSGTLRGFIYRRFTSDNAISYSLELRSWFFSLPFKNMDIGGQVFVDGGRVFANDNWDSMFSNHKFALGLGGVMSIFIPDFILKAEIGFSEDGTGIYLGTGYSF